MRQWEFGTGGSHSLYKPLPVKRRNHPRGTFKPAEALSLFLSPVRCGSGCPRQESHDILAPPSFSCLLSGWEVGAKWPARTPQGTANWAKMRSPGLVLGIGAIIPHETYTHGLVLGHVAILMDRKGPKTEVWDPRLQAGTTHCTLIKVDLESHGAEGLDADRGNLLHTNPIEEDSGRKMWMQIFPNSGDGCK